MDTYVSAFNKVIGGEKIESRHILFVDRPNGDYQEARQYRLEGRMDVHEASNRGLGQSLDSSRHGQYRDGSSKDDNTNESMR